MALIGTVERLLAGMAKKILGETQADLRGLLIPWAQDDLVSSQRASLIITRVRMVSALFAVLTPLWIILDTLFFETATWTLLAVARIVASVAFAVLSMAYRRSDRMKDAYVSIAALFAIPTAFYVFSHWLFAGSADGIAGLAASLVAGYAFLPFIMAAGLSVFPLTALEGVIFALPALGVEVAAGIFGAGVVGPDAHLGLVWLLGLIAMVAVLSGMSQLHYLTEIIIKSSHDPLTGAFNRSAGEEVIDKYFYLSYRNRTPLTLIFFDLDKFKSVNDVYGHEAGDAVLRNMAAQIMEAIRVSDAFIRWGGEEFLVVAPYTTGDKSNALLERIQTAGLGKRPDGSPVTASLGRAELLADKVETPSELIELADQRMYRAKETGRNRLCYGDGEDDMQLDLFS